MFNDSMFSSKTDNWSTPDSLFQDLNNEFGFTLDVCASHDNAKCNHYFTKVEDGLLQPWGSATVWCNPPYGRKIGQWVKRCFEHGSSGYVAVMLLPSRTDTKWFHDFIYHKAEIRFIKGRLRFGDSNCNAPFPSMVVIFRKDDYNVR